MPGVGRASTRGCYVAQGEIVVVDDGSTDDTAELVEGLGLANVRVLRQDNAGKATALNADIAAARHDLVVLIDGDTVFEPGTVAALVGQFADPAVGAVAGNARVANRSGMLARLQNIEYIVGFNIDRRVQDSWGVVTTGGELRKVVRGRGRRARRRILGGVLWMDVAELRLGSVERGCRRGRRCMRHRHHRPSPTAATRIRQFPLAGIRIARSP